MITTSQTRLWLRDSKQARLHKPTEVLLASRPRLNTTKMATVVNLRLDPSRPRWGESNIAAGSHARLAPNRNLTAHTQKKVLSSCSRLSAAKMATVARVD